MMTLTEDAADARHDTVYVPPERCKERVQTPSLMCNGYSSTTSVHHCSRSRATHIGETPCVCRCGFKWDIHMSVLPNNG